jgi:MauM/NapG family ferredoxin protein
LRTGTFRRLAQAVSLAAFLSLLGLAMAGLGGSLVALFVQADPAASLLAAVSARRIGWFLLPAAVVLASAPFAGRLFCGWLCPLGTTFDASDRLIRRKGPRRTATGGAGWKFGLLLLLAGSALLGVSAAAWAAPLTVATRFYALAVQPVVAWLGNAGLDLARPLAGDLNAPWLAFAEFADRRYAAVLFAAGLPAVFMGLGRIAPRFWCRYACPAGALLGLAASRPLLRRQVAEGCTECGACRRVCPMGAIPDNPRRTEHEECIQCRRCRDRCPEGVISFGSRQPETSRRNRRAVLGWLGLGAAAAVAVRAGLHWPEAEGAAPAKPDELLRPPGARPEPEFLALCVRCGECSAACPTNTLQPTWFLAGLAGAFTPVIEPRANLCDPRCTRCGEVCPTHAIRELGTRERIWAKTGSAVITRDKCLAWEQKKKCLVCDEVCPYDAVEFKPREGSAIFVPHVRENRCQGCGACEKHCPVRPESAIRVAATGEIRLSKGSYEQEATARNLELKLRPKKEMGKADVSYPGQDQKKGPAPGFTAD